MVSRLHAAVRRRIHRPALDRALTVADDPWATPELSARASELITPTSRHRIANELRHVLDEAQRPIRGFSSRVPLRRREIVAERGTVIAMIAELESPRPVAPRGVARIRNLLRDGTSPLYGPAGGTALGPALRAARAALSPGDGVVSPRGPHDEQDLAA